MPDTIAKAAIISACAERIASGICSGRPPLRSWLRHEIERAIDEFAMQALLAAMRQASLEVAAGTVTGPRVHVG